MKPLSLLFAVALCVAASQGFAQNQVLRIVSPGEDAVIQTDINSPIENYAAQELQRAIKLMTGTELQIRPSSETIAGAKIIIGIPSTNTRIATNTSLGLGLGGEERIAIEKEGFILFLAGNTPRAALYATYTYLQDYLGARWYWPDPTGEYMPQLDSIVHSTAFTFTHVPHLDVRSVAMTGQRSTSTAAGMDLTDLWMARNRLNWISDRSNTTTTVLADRRKKGFLLRRAGHNISAPNEVITTTMLQGADSVLAAMNANGIRLKNGTVSLPEHVCWSNPRVQELMGAMLADWWDEAPFPDVIHFYPADNARYCQCQPCKNMTVNPSDISTRWQIMADSLVKKAGRIAGNDKKYWTYAYWHYQGSAQYTAAMDFIPYALDLANYRTLLSDTLSTKHGQTHNHINSWLASGRDIGIRGYEFIIFKTPMFAPTVSWMADQIKWLTKKGMRGYLSEILYYGAPNSNEPEQKWWNCSRMSLYTAAKTMWDTAVNADSLVLDWCTKVYGPARFDLNGYYWDMDSAWMNGVKGPEVLKGFNKTPRRHIDSFLTANLFHKSYKRFADGLQRIDTSSALDAAAKTRIETQILLEREMLDNWLDTFQVAKGRGSRYRLSIMARTTTGGLITQLPSFETSFGNNSIYPTTVDAGWMEDSLHLQIHTAEQNLITEGTFTRNDGPTFNQGLEIYIQPDTTKPNFYRLRIRPEGSFVDAKTYSGLIYDSSWNMSCVVKTVRNSSNELVYKVQIPLAALGLAGVEGKEFRMAIRRKASNAAITGWPENNSNYAGLFSLVKFVGNPEVDNSVVGSGAQGLPPAASLQNVNANSKAPKQGLK
ncbi:MAG TPA: DUF4838 domain-containing protein [Flavisolibacter sp.]|nr:DUF4838 domain-containing protein [Flavisolibacter sp.]